MSLLSSPHPIKTLFTNGHRPPCEPLPRFLERNEVSCLDAAEEDLPDVRETLRALRATEIRMNALREEMGYDHEPLDHPTSCRL